MCSNISPKMWWPAEYAAELGEENGSIHRRIKRSWHIVDRKKDQRRIFEAVLDKMTDDQQMDQGGESPTREWIEAGHIRMRESEWSGFRPLCVREHLGKTIPKLLPSRCLGFPSRRSLVLPLYHVYLYASRTDGTIVVHFG